MPISAIPRRSGSPSKMRWLPWVLLVCAALAMVGGLLGRPALSIVAAVVLLAAWLPSLWRRRSIAMAGGWLVLALLVLVPSALGHVQLALAALPAVVLSALSWMFARTLRRGVEPLVARAIRLIEGDGRLAIPGVAAYARGVTMYWAWVLGVLAALVLATLLLARPDGWLAMLGVPLPLVLPGGLLAWFPEGGCWGVLVLAFAGEYAFRRWRLRGIPHPSLRRFVTRMAHCWPQLVHGEDGTR
jgi:hypothetical protein